MAIMAACVDILDEDGVSLVPSNADGTRPLFKLAVDASIPTTVTRSGDTATVMLSGGSGSPANVLAAINGQAITPATVVTSGAVTVGGALDVAGTLTVDELVQVGGTSYKTQTATVTGGASVVAFTTAVANGTISRLLNFSCLAHATAHVIVYDTTAPLVFTVEGGVFNDPIGAVDLLLYSTGLPPSLEPTWAAGVLTLTFTGPRAVISGIGSNGSGKVRVTCSSGSLTSDLDSLPVTISGVVGTGDAAINGVGQVSTQVSATEFDLLGRTWSSGAYTSGGLVVLTAAPVFSLTTTAQITVAPAP